MTQGSNDKSQTFYITKHVPHVTLLKWYTKLNVITYLELEFCTQQYIKKFLLTIGNIKVLSPSWQQGNLLNVKIVCDLHCNVGQTQDTLSLKILKIPAYWYQVTLSSLCTVPKLQPHHLPVTFNVLGLLRVVWINMYSWYTPLIS